jgi:hypothetical protein
MTIRAMTLHDLRMVLRWAADEGWNPGLEDAEAFHAADPTGFLIKEVEGAPAAAISVVNHDADFAFLGLYLCKPEFRGQGHGMDVWRAGIAHAGSRSVGLDGVPDQQANYARSGFVKYGKTVRYEGLINAEPDPRAHCASPAEIESLTTRDTKSAGMRRTNFARAWLGQFSTRQTIVLSDGTKNNAFATFRRCGVGTKIGPFQASSEADAQALLSSNPFAGSDEPVFVDVQDECTSFSHLLEKLGFKPIFETARMYRGAPPNTHPARYQAIATMELG